MASYDLVFEGGGAKGSCFVGALEALRAGGHTHRRLVGTSAGAITATLLAAGFTPEEMLAAVNERLDGKPRFASFMDPPSKEDFSEDQVKHSETMEMLKTIRFPVIPNFDWLDERILHALLESPLYCHLFAFVECGGLFSGRKFREWINEKLAMKGIAEGTTFEDFARQTQSDLSLVVSDTSDVEMLVLNHRTAPKCPVAWAVRMSMSIPFVWCEVVWQAAWGTYLGRTKTGNLIVDGGVLSNFPIRLVDEEPAAGSWVREVMGDTPAGGAGTLGLLIDETLPVPGAENTDKPPKLAHQLRTVQRVGRLVDTMTGAGDNEQIRSHAKLICRLPAKGYGTTEFDMRPDRLTALIDGGRSAMDTYLAGLN